MSDAPTPAAPEAAALGKALELSRKINDKAAALLAPLEREMKIMQWPAAYRSVMWEAVKLAALEKMEAADAE